LLLSSSSSLVLLGVFAEFETNLRKEQLEGIAKAKAAGVYKGRRPTVDVLRVRALRQEGVGPLRPSIGRSADGQAIHNPKQRLCDVRY
jgi:DNA invertase Pin-like site-specific DNA recombinase